MNRRAFLGTLGLLAAPRDAGAQPSDRVYRIGHIDGEAALVRIVTFDDPLPS